MTVSIDGASAVAAAPVLDWIVTLNSSTGLVEWAPVLLLAAGVLWLDYAVHARSERRRETLNARSAREVEEARR